MKGIGIRLLSVRRQWGLSLREVEERSLRLDQNWGDQSYQISASWLARVERGRHELTVSKLIALATIYQQRPEELLMQCWPGEGEVVQRPQLPGSGPFLVVANG